jgi:hypothetical protein
MRQRANRYGADWASRTPAKKQTNRTGRVLGKDGQMLRVEAVEVPGQPVQRKAGAHRVEAAHGHLRMAAAHGQLEQCVAGQRAQRGDQLAAQRREPQRPVQQRERRLVVAQTQQTQAAPCLGQPLPRQHQRLWSCQGTR